MLRNERRCSKPVLGQRVRGSNPNTKAADFSPAHERTRTVRILEVYRYTIYNIVAGLAERDTAALPELIQGWLM